MRDPASLYGGCTLITGASSGIGAELARQVARHGGRLALLARREARLAEVARDVEAAGARALVVACDVADPDAVAAADARVTAELGPVDVAFLNAGVHAVHFDRPFDAAELRHMFAVNVFGVANWLEHLLPPMLARGAGVIVGVSSIAGLRAVPGSAPYSASKAAVSVLLEGLRLEHAGSGVQVTTVEPGFIKSEMTDRNPFPKPFMLETGDAVRRILEGVARGRGVIRFPFPLSTGMTVAHALPEPIYRGIGRLMMKTFRKPV